jgi:hypothetical protein
MMVLRLPLAAAEFPFGLSFAATHSYCQAVDVMSTDSAHLRRTKSVSKHHQY